MFYPFIKVLKNSALVSDNMAELDKRVSSVIKTPVIFIITCLSAFHLAAQDIQLPTQLDIQRGLFSDQYQSFQLDEQEVIYVIQENTTAITRGVAVLIADSGVPIVGQDGFALLANELNAIGWVTILLPAPVTAFNPPMEEETPVSNELVEADEEPSTAVTEEQGDAQSLAEQRASMDMSKSMVTSLNATSFLQHEQHMIDLLEAIVEKSQEYPGYFLVISQGTSAAWLSKIYAERKLDTPDAFVAVSPYWPDRQYNQLLPAWLANTPMPVLDLYNDWDNEWAKHTITHRQISAVKALKLQYRQRELVGVNIRQQSSIYMSKEIYGWLSYMGW